MPSLGSLNVVLVKFTVASTLACFFNSTRNIKSFFPVKGRLARSFMSKVIYKASYWDCKEFYIGKTKRRQEPIWSVQLPYSVCETAFSQVGLFLD